MKFPFYKSLVAAGALASVGALVACGDDDSSSGNPAQPSVGSVCDGVVATEDVSVMDLGNGTKLVIYPVTIEGAGKVTFADGTPFGSFDGAAIYDAAGVKFVDTDIEMLSNKCQATATIDPGTGEVVLNSSASSAVPGEGPAAGSSATVPGTNPGTDPGTNPGTNPGTVTSSGSAVPGEGPVAGSSATVPGDETPESSGSVEPVVPGSPIEAYPVPALKDLLSSHGSGEGWSSRYWDACRSHCSQITASDTSSQAAYEAAGTVARTCNIKGFEIPVFTIDPAAMSNEYWTGWKVVGNSCNYKDQGEGIANQEDGAFVCMDMAPIQVNDTLAYAYVASAPGATACGQCFHLHFNGGAGEKGGKFYHDGDQVKAAHKELKGKHMIVMSTNIGTDVEVGQFDMMVPGGGTGIFDALSKQVGVPMSKFVQYGGFLSTCQQEIGSYDAPASEYQSCVKKYCAEVFTGFDDLLRGCNWFADWYMAADNPSYYWEPVECPQYLTDKYGSNYNKTRRNDYKPRSSWASYTGTSPDDLEKAGKYKGDGTN